MILSIEMKMAMTTALLPIGICLPLFIFCFISEDNGFPLFPLNSHITMPSKCRLI